MPGTVTVACKLPNGLKLRLQQSSDIRENTIFGPRDSKRWFPVPKGDPKGKEVMIHGFAHRMEKSPKAPIRGGFALTHNVDADFFEEWLKQNAGSDLIENGLIYASAKTPDVEAHARDYKNERCGMEAVDPANLPNEFKRKIATATSAAA